MRAAPKGDRSPSCRRWCYRKCHTPERLQSPARSASRFAEVMEHSGEQASTLLAHQRQPSTGRASGTRFSSIARKFSASRRTAFEPFGRGGPEEPDCGLAAGTKPQYSTKLNGPRSGSIGSFRTAGPGNRPGHANILGDEWLAVQTVLTKFSYIFSTHSRPEGAPPELIGLPKRCQEPFPLRGQEHQRSIRKRFLTPFQSEVDPARCVGAQPNRRQEVASPG